MRERLAEDRRALALAGRRAINLKFLDDQYRNRQGTLDQVVDELRHYLAPGTAILARAGIGGHPDHLHARAAAMRLRDDHAVALYAELPHAIRAYAASWPRSTRSPTNHLTSPTRSATRSPGSFYSAKRKISPTVTKD